MIDPTQNPTSTPIKTDQDERNSRDPIDSKDAVRLLRKIQDATVWQAKIKSLSVDHTDEYTALIFYTKSDDETTAVYRDIKIYEPDINNNHVLDSWVEVSLDNNMVGLILPPRLPKGTGQWKALLLIDSSNPGTPEWDYWRFQQ
jgi:hypothetical protein